jgi:hypothetical protein
MDMSSSYAADTHLIRQDDGRIVIVADKYGVQQMITRFSKPGVTRVRWAYKHPAERECQCYRHLHCGASHERFFGRRQRRLRNSRE